ncbi:MAG TPA: hypothetical protein K8V84_10455 [Nocardiopsis listeri]|uniref:hypothetical protein n=1 Tax=Nocardiopsis listeri TaxID=53440 RepID=UPI001DAA1C11|nr:hypothetical protein [Nocardiopsis listeri]HJE58916.1 hypothetical protein [Nocardiopsis listeri]
MGAFGGLIILMLLAFVAVVVAVIVLLVVLVSGSKNPSRAGAPGRRPPYGHGQPPHPGNPGRYPGPQGPGGA